MKTLTFEEVKNSDLVIYSYIRGSHAYGLEKPDGTSDIDTAMVYIEPLEQMMGLGLDYQEQVSDERHDNVAYSLHRFMNLLLNSNPTVLESLFIPERCVVYEHPIMTEIKKHRDKFVTKACFKPFMEYGRKQIEKCRGLNKRFLQEKIERKSPLYFANTFNGQGSTKILYWLEHRGLHQKYCGVTNVPNMRNENIYYDWGTHFREIPEDSLENLIEGYINSEEEDCAHIIHEIKESGGDEDVKKRLEPQFRMAQRGNMVRFICRKYNVSIGDVSFARWYREQVEKEPLHYRGLVNENGTSNELRLCSVEKDEEPICHIDYNKDAYSAHCKEYKNQKTWEENCNPERYKENCGKKFDRKNVAHSVRLLHMGIEIARGEGVKVDRTDIDRDFIMGIRMGDTTYEEIMAYIEGKKREMDEAIASSTLPDAIDVDFVNDLLIDIRKRQLALWK